MRRIPPGLVLGLSFGVMSVVLDVVVTGKRPVEWGLVCQAALIAAMFVAASGALELARRVAGRVREKAAQAAALGFGVVALQRLADLFVHSSTNTTALVTAGLALAGIGLGLAAGNRVLAVAGGLLGVVAVPPAPVMDKLGGSAEKVMLVGWALWGAIAAGAAFAAARDSAEPAERKDLAVTGLRRAAIGLWIRLGSASILVTAMYFAPIRYGTTVVGATIGAVSMILVASGLVRVASGSGPEMPRGLAYFAALLGLWSAVIWSIEARLAYEKSPPAMLNWPQAPQYIAAAAILVLLVCIHRLAINSGDEKLQRNAKTAITIFAALTLISLPLISVGVPDVKHMAKFYALSFGTTFGVGALVIAAATCSKAAAALDARPALATATLRTPPRDAV